MIFAKSKDRDKKSLIESVRNFFFVFTTTSKELDKKKEYSKDFKYFSDEGKVYHWVACYTDGFGITHCVFVNERGERIDVMKDEIEIDWVKRECRPKQKNHK